MHCQLLLMIYDLQIVIFLILNIPGIRGFGVLLVHLIPGILLVVQLVLAILSHVLSFNILINL